MGFLGNPIPNWLQWIGFIVGLAGTGLTVWAALSAMSARHQAELARDAVLRMTRTVQLTDLVEGMFELQLLVAKQDFQLITAKSSHVHSRVVRFLAEGYNQINDSDAEGLAAARDQLLTIVDSASTGKGIAKIRRAHASAFAHLNRGLGHHRAEPHRND